MLLPWLGRNDKDRRVMINTIGPLWDGNEVWLLTAGGAMFAAFPGWYATLFSGLYLPLFLVLVEISDLIFAVDSIPAIFAVTADPFIVYTSNIFAILGLRAMYFLLADGGSLPPSQMRLGAHPGVHRRKDAGGEFYPIPIGLALLVVAVALVASVVASPLVPRERAATHRA